MNIKLIKIAAAAILLAALASLSAFAQTESATVEVATQSAQLDETQIETQRQEFYKFFTPREQTRQQRQAFAALFTAPDAPNVDIEIFDGSRMGKATFVLPGRITVNWTVANVTSCTFRSVSSTGSVEIGSGSASGGVMLDVTKPVSITGFCTLPSGGVIVDDFFVQVATTGPTAGTIGICAPGATAVNVGTVVRPFFEHNLSTQNVIWAAATGSPDFDPMGQVGYQRDFVFNTPGLKSINAAAMADGRIISGTCQVLVLQTRSVAPIRGAQQ